MQILSQRWPACRAAHRMRTTWNPSKWLSQQHLLPSSNSSSSLHRRLLQRPSLCCQLTCWTSRHQPLLLRLPPRSRQHLLLRPLLHPCRWVVLRATPHPSSTSLALQPDVSESNRPILLGYLQEQARSIYQPAAVMPTPQQQQQAYAPPPALAYTAPKPAVPRKPCMLSCMHALHLTCAAWL